MYIVPGPRTDVNHGRTGTNTCAGENGFAEENGDVRKVKKMKSRSAKLGWEMKGTGKMVDPHLKRNACVV